MRDASSSCTLTFYLFIYLFAVFVFFIVTHPWADKRDHTNKHNVFNVEVYAWFFAIAFSLWTAQIMDVINVIELVAKLVHTGKLK